MKITRVEQDPNASIGHVGFVISEMARVTDQKILAIDAFKPLQQCWI